MRLLTAAAILLLLAGCIDGQQEIGLEVRKKDTGAMISGVAIASIIGDPAGYRGQEVIVSGKVLPGLAFEFVSEQPFQIIQGESLLWVITRGVSPSEGEFVTVRGTVASPYQIKGRSYQLALLEEERL